MRTRKMKERINWYRKDYIHDYYTRVIPNFKDYDKISRVKMVEEVYKEYSNYHNIIDICTVRELKYLQKVIDSKVEKEELFNKKYDWERKMLHSKFLLENDYPNTIFIPEEIVDKTKEALDNVDWELAEKKDRLNEVLVGFCKIQALSILDNVSQIGEAITGMDKESIKKHMLYNKLFNYYVMIYPKKYQEFKEDIYVALYQDYYSIEEEIEKERKKQGAVGTIQINTETLRALFYNDFDINNQKINKFLEEFNKLPIIQYSVIHLIKDYAVLNKDRKELKENIKSIPALADYDLTNFFKVLDEAMDEMPSGVLNGFTPNEVKKIKQEELQNSINKEITYTKQSNACLSQKDAKLFYKIYFGLLEFTNNKYNIKKGLKIYGKNGINPREIYDIVEKFWENKNTIISEFCQRNPYKFNSDELEVTKNFKNGIRDIFIVIKYEKEHTAIMCRDKIYMIKGINDNIDNIIYYKDLPSAVRTTIIPFKNVLIYDGIFIEYGIKMGIGFEKIIKEEYSKAIKYYHL